MKKHILIIDDTPILLKNTVALYSEEKAIGVSDYIEALAYLREQAQSDSLPDIILADLLYDGKYDSRNKTAFYKELEVFAARSQDLQPNEKGVLRYVSPEIIILSGMSGKDLYEPTLTLKWQTPFPVLAFSKCSSDAYKYIKGEPVDNGFAEYESKGKELFPKLSLEGAINGIRVKDASYEHIIRGVCPEDVLSVYGSVLNSTQEQQNRAITFDGGAGEAVVGQAVFSIENAKKLKEIDPDMPIVLIGKQNSQSVMAQAAILDGAANFNNEPVAHYKELARGKGFSILSANFQHAAEVNCVLGDNCLQHSDGVILEGDTVSLDPENGLLYPEAVELIPASKPEGFGELVDFINDRNSCAYEKLSFLPQAETAKDMSSIHSNLALSKMENYFIYKPEGRDVLNEYLFDPTDESLAHVKEFLKTYIREEIVEASRERAFYEPTFRLMDFKPEELLLDTGRLEELKGLTELDDLTGTQLFEMLPEFYRVQVEAILEEIPSDYMVKDDDFLYHISLKPDIVIPKVRDIEHYDEISEMVHQVASKEWDHSAINVSVLPMMESVEAADPEFVSELVKRVEKIQQIGDSSSHSSAILFVGGSDLMSDIMGGLSRSDEKAIQEWMEDKETTDHPFRSILPELRAVLKQIVDTVRMESRMHVSVRFCGVQAQYLDGAMALQDIGVNQAVVPPEERYLEGLPLAMYLREKQSVAPSRHEMGKKRRRRGMENDADLSF